MALGLEDIMRHCGPTRPNTFVLVGDNTVKELKNRYNLTAMASLVLHHKIQLLDPNQHTFFSICVFICFAPVGFCFWMLFVDPGLHHFLQVRMPNDAPC